MNAGLSRANLHYEICFKTKNFYTKLLKELRDTAGAKVIYRSSNRASESLALKLQQDGVSALPYHSGLSSDQRTINRNQFLNNTVEVIVTTNFSSSDIHKSDIRLIIHHDLPQSIHRYFQETGKAGRDGKPARCILFFSYHDVRNIKWVTKKRVDLSSREREATYTDLQQVIDYVLSNECRLSLLPNQPKGHCGKCDNCSAPVPNLDWTIDSQKFLSCIARFDQRGENFGVSYTSDILRGSISEKIFQHKHHELSTYGIGKDKSAEDWRGLAQLLIFKGLIEEVEKDDYTILKLNEKSWEVMRKQRAVSVCSAMWRAQTIYNPQPSSDARSKTLELYRQGLSVAEIAERRGVQEQTILSQLADSILKGELININLFIPKGGQAEILQTLKMIGTEPLKNVYDHLGGRYNYGQIRLVLAQWQQYGEMTETTENIFAADNYYGSESDYQENSYEYDFDRLSGHDTSVDLGYLEDITNSNVY